MSDNEAITINIGDFQTILNIIDICSQRGSFKAIELEGVGKIYNKLLNFIKQSQKQSQSEGQSQSQSQGQSEGQSQEIN